MTNSSYRSASAAKTMLTGATDMGFFFLALSAGRKWPDAHVLSFVAATVLAAAITRLARRRPADIVHSPTPRVAGILVALCVLFLRGGLLATLVDTLGLPVGGAFFFTAAASALMIFWGDMLQAPPVGSDPARPAHRLIATAVAYIVLLRLLYADPFELLHEEGYYWLYAQFIDIGYLDHPPMVGWLIRASTALFGSSEFGVRIGAFGSWLVAALYMARLTEAVAGRAAAWNALLLTAILPVFFALGMIMVPDAPLVACWAAALYYLHRALIEERAGAWMAVGLCMGLGLLSKYTMVLLGGATVVFVSATPGSRHWLRRREPYLAAALALVLFSPVIVWNAANDWASFYFQGIGRHRIGFNFGLQDLVGSALLLLTPTGLLSVAAVMLFRKRVRPELEAGKQTQAFGLLTCLTLVPLSVFFVFSLFRLSKLNWTGPIWLGMLPFVALFTNPIGSLTEPGRPRRPFFPRLWPATTATVLVLYGVVLHYLVLGLPGVPYPHNLLGIGKRDLAHRIAESAQTVETRTGQRPLVVCWEAERLAGGLAYYLSRASSETPAGDVPRAPLTTTGPHLFGESSQMFSYWHPPQTFQDQTFLFVGPGRGPLNYLRVLARATPRERIQKMVVRNHGKVTGTYFSRLFVFRENGGPD